MKGAVNRFMNLDQCGWRFAGVLLIVLAGVGGAFYHLAGPPPEAQNEPAELLVSDPPGDFEETAFKLGFSVNDKVELNELSMVIYHLRAPSGMKVPDALDLLRKRFLGLNADGNQALEAKPPLAPITGGLAAHL